MTFRVDPSPQFLILLLLLLFIIIIVVVVVNIIFGGSPRELQICESSENVEFGVINEKMKIAMKAF